MAGGEWNPPERAAFDDALAAHMAETFPTAQLEWVENHRRLMLAFSDGCTCTVWEPNFYMILGSLWSARELCAKAAEQVKAQHQKLLRGEVI